MSQDREEEKGEKECKRWKKQAVKKRTHFRRQAAEKATPKKRGMAFVERSYVSAKKKGLAHKKLREIATKRQKIA